MSTLKKKLNILPEPKVASVGRFPPWLHRKMPDLSALQETGNTVYSHLLHTVCEEAKCPNRFECWSNKTATFLAMGKQCTRNCGFCGIDFSKTPPPLDANEPENMALSVQELGLKHVVITMVARDDLEDGGSLHLALIIQAIRKRNPDVTLEVLTSDFAGNKQAWKTVLKECPEIFNYNIETVERLTPKIRHKATYQRTLELLHFAKNFQPASKMRVKSGLMVGLGESEEEVFQTLRDLKEAGCEIVTIGQYLQAISGKLLVKEFVHPDQFKKYEEYGLKIGFSFVYSAPFVRSSYNAGLILEKLN